MAKRPLWLWIDPTRVCEPACDFCHAKVSRNADHLTPGELRRYFDILLGDSGVAIQRLHFNWRGDPLMNPDILELLAEAEARNLAFPVELRTNGTAIDEATARDLASVVRDIEIFVSIDGGNQASHDVNRGAGTYASALSGLDLLLKARGASRSPRIGLLQLDLGVPEEEYDPEFIRVAYLADEWVRINPVHPGSARRIRPRLPSSPRTGGQAGRSLPPAQPVDRWWAREVPRGGDQPQGPCFWAGNAFFIAPRGDVSVCLLSHSADGVIGNLLSTPLSEILGNSAKYRAEITRLGRSGIPHCAKCRVFAGEARPEI